MSLSNSILSELPKKMLANSSENSKITAALAHALSARLGSFLKFFPSETTTSN